MADLEPFNLPYQSEVVETDRRLSKPWLNAFMAWMQRVKDGAVNLVSGTAGRILVTGTQTNPIINIDPAYVASAAQGGTGQSSYLLGDTLYASAPTTLSKLPGSTQNFPLILTQTGTGTVSAAPAWMTRSELNRVFNLLDFDVTGDGITDDTDGIQRAFNAVGEFGGTLIIPVPPVAYVVNGESNGSLPNGSAGLETGTTYVHVVGFGSKIKQMPRTTPYTMFRFRSNMVIEGIELEGYIHSGNNDSNVVPLSGYGFRGKRIGGSMNNVTFINCVAHNCTFDGWYIDDQSGGGTVQLINCDGFNNVRNDFAAVRAISVVINGGTWAKDTITVNKNASIDFEPDAGKIIYAAVVQNIRCYYRLGFAGAAGTAHYGVAENVTFDGSLKGADTGLLGENFGLVRVSGLQFINSARTFRYNASYYDPAGGGPQVLHGRFLLENGSQPQLPNEIPYTCAKKAGWTSTISGGGTITDSYPLGESLGIKFLNASGYAYLSKNVAAYPGTKYSFGCKIRIDSTLPTEKAGMWVVFNGAATTQKYTLIPTLPDNIEYVNGCVTAPDGTTSVDIYIGTDNAVSMSITVADVYFVDGIADNESVLGNYCLQVATVNKILAKGGIEVGGGATAEANLFVEPETGLCLRATTGTSYDFAIYDVNPLKTLMRRPTGGGEELQFPGIGKNTFSGDVVLGSAGNGFKIKEGTNATMGVATLAAGTVTVNTTKVTANSRLVLTIQALGTVSIPNAIGVTARTAGTSFTITSADATDTSVIAWQIFEPA